MIAALAIKYRISQLSSVSYAVVYRDYERFAYRRQAVFYVCPVYFVCHSVTNFPFLWAPRRGSLNAWLIFVSISETYKALHFQYFMVFKILNYVFLVGVFAIETPSCVSDSSEVFTMFTLCASNFICHYLLLPVTLF